MKLSSDTKWEKKPDRVLALVAAALTVGALCLNNAR